MGVGPLETRYERTTAGFRRQVQPATATQRKLKSAVGPALGRVHSCGIGEGRFLGGPGMVCAGKRAVGCARLSGSVRACRVARATPS